MREDLDVKVPKSQDPVQKITESAPSDLKVKKILDQEFPSIPNFRWEIFENGSTLSINVIKKESFTYLWDFVPNPNVEAVQKLLNIGKLYRNYQQVSTLSCFLIVNATNNELISVANSCKIKLFTV